MTDTPPGDFALRIESSDETDVAAAKAGARVVTLTGHLDESTQAAVVGQIRAIFAAGCHRLVVDMDGVSYVTSTGFAALVSLWQAARDAGGDLVVLNPPPNVSVLFRVLKMNEQIPVAANREAAFSRLGSLPDALPLDEDSTPGPELLPGEEAAG